MQAAFGFRAVQTAREHLEALVAEGALVKAGEGRARGYRLPDGEGTPSVRIPVLGRVQAGALTTALEEPEGFVELPGGDARAARDRFALRVRGDSMIDAGILEDDLVIVRRQDTADPGDLVVAIVGDEATVKVFRRRRGRVELHPANPAYPPIVPPPDQLAILGKVVELRRRYDDGAAAIPRHSTSAARRR